ncbi:MAG TPA: kelch repeat-containing protein [Planctomycetota bacterium]|nr:kelch repeat-containing protein [Planctomycetota bacterium]
MTPNRFLVATLPLLLALSSLAAEGAPEWAAKLEANKWTRLEKEKGRSCGVRNGAAVVWLAGEKKFLVVDGMQYNANEDRVGKITYPYEIQTFDPATQEFANVFPKGKEGVWGEKTGASKAPGFPGNSWDFRVKDAEGVIRLMPSTAIANSFVFDPVAGQLYVLLGTNMMRYDVAGRTWELGKIPDLPVTAGTYSLGGGAGRATLEGAQNVLDPVNREILQLGGRSHGAPRGTVGDWALSLDTKQWRKMECASALLDPLRAKALAAARLARDGENAARNVFYAALPNGKEAEAARGQPAKLLADAVKTGEELAAALAGAKGEGWEAEALAAARPKVAAALAGLKAAQAGLAGGQVSAALIKNAFDAAWALDEAADCLASSPPPRMFPAAAYNPDIKGVVLFGGDHGDFVYGDTWIYDCAKRSWRQVFSKSAPPGRMRSTMLHLPGRKKMAIVGGSTIGNRFVIQSRDNPATPDMWEFDPASGQWAIIGTADLGGIDQWRPWTLTSSLAAGDGDVVLGLACCNVHYVEGRGHNWDGSTNLLRLAAGDAAATAKAAVPGGARVYLTKVSCYDPTWLDAGPRGDPKEMEAFYASLKPNTWTVLPKPQRMVAFRTWGTAVHNPEMDEIYYWDGGHQSDCSNLVHTYHPATNRWSIGYVAEFFGSTNKGMSFNGRPDCSNHTYITYAWDPATKRMVAASFGGVSVYNPERRDWDSHHIPPFGFNLYVTKAVATPKGVVFWNPGHCEGQQMVPFFGLFDAKAGKFEAMPMKGAKGAPQPGHSDSCVMRHDPKRDVLWILSGDPSGGAKPTGRIWRYDLKTGGIEQLDPAGAASIGASMKGWREAVYLPRQDLVLFNNFNAAGTRQVAYDPEKNRWVTLAITRGKHNPQALGGVGSGYVYDSKRDLVWAIGEYNENFVLKIDPATMDASEEAK